MEHATLLLITSCVFGFFMAWGIGANDVANAMGTSVGSKAITIVTALFIAAIFESAGALLAGGNVTQTIRGEILNPQAFINNPHLLIYGMMAALLAAGTWLLLATQRGWPVSTTHSIVGAIIGFGLVELGPRSINWSEMTTIAGSWVITPFLAGFIAYVIFMSIQRVILNTDDPFHQAKKYLPIYLFFVAVIIALVTVFKGLKHLGWHINTMEGYSAAIIIGIITMLLGYFALHKLVPEPTTIDPQDRYHNVEKVFAVLMVFTASCMAFAHGSNDVANAIGPLAAIIGILQTGTVAISSHMPKWLLLLGAAGIVVGLGTYGYKVIATIGEKITHLTPSRGFAAEFATATTIVIASGTGLPVSTSQTLVGAVLGVGFARGIGALNLKVIRNIFMSWVITLPAGAILAVFYYLLIKTIFSQ